MVAVSMALAVLFHEAVALAGRFPVLAGADLEVGEGEVVHLRGPNGAGKTSLLRAAAGLIPVTSGTAVVLGHDLRAERRDVRREVGLLGHATFLYDELTVADNLRFALRAARVPGDAAAPALERLGLVGRLRDVTVGRLSAGQRRRVALAVLVARRPRLWLLDEPHAGLDEGAREIVDALVAEARAGGSTVLIASHELERAGALADRVLRVAGGRVEPVAPAPVPPSGPVPAEAQVVAGAR
jgi:heme ABC exporter ATP-binding subunit CcmA